MTSVARLVRKVCSTSESVAEDLPEAPENFRDTPAWILLGEPGMGKSELLKFEAENTGGLYLQVMDFIYLDIDDGWRNKTIFIDGLDEVRAGRSGEGSVLHQIKRQLQRLGYPSFRIACRAADWYGQTDLSDLKVAGSGKEIVELLLEPLAPDDVLVILKENLGVSEPEQFIAEAKERGIDELLVNPKLLELLVDANESGSLPATRDETFNIACHKLVKEPNKKYRDKVRSEPESVDGLIDAAGQLCAVLLLSDKRGVARDEELASSQFPGIDEFNPPDRASAARVINSMLFRLDNVERFSPSHRSVAEYLASRWIAKQIDKGHLPQGRVLNVLLGKNSRAVAGLRGLYGWLALHCKSARARLISSDPLAAVLYGDVRPMPAAAKHSILIALKSEASRYASFLWDQHSNNRLGDLADPELKDDLLAALTTEERVEASQSYADCVLNIIERKNVLPNLSKTLLDIIRDHTWLQRIRSDALELWLMHIQPLESAVSLLNEIAQNQIVDADDQLAGILLAYLYPQFLTVDQLLQHLHRAKDSHLYGSYIRFWTRFLPRSAPVEHLPLLLDALVNRPEFTSHDPFEPRLNQMADRLLVRGIEAYGDSVSDERLFSWLGIGIDEEGFRGREEEPLKIIAAWLSARPDCYKAVLAQCYIQCAGKSNARPCVFVNRFRLHGADIPDDIGLWHLNQSSEMIDEVLTEMHLSEAVFALMSSKGSDGLTLEMIERWCDVHPERAQIIGQLLVSEYPSWQTEDVKNRSNREQKRVQERRRRSVSISRYLPDIATGEAPPQIYNILAGVWENRFVDTQGETPEERFEAYCENGREVLDLAQHGFLRCIERDDLPSVREIIDLGIKQREHFIRLPCLLGMKLRWRDNPAAIALYEDATLQRMLAFQITYAVGDAPDWFVYLVQRRPELVSSVLADYASAALKAGHSYVAYVHELEADIRYKEVAINVVPHLLQAFPVRARSSALRYLEPLVKAAVRYCPETLLVMAGKKVSIKSMDVAQKIYWLAAAAMLDTEKNESALWRYIGKSHARVAHLSRFLAGPLGETEYFELPARTIGRLVEVMAPYAKLDWTSGDGVVTEAMHLGDRVRAMIARLGALTTMDAVSELERLLGLESMKKLKFSLERARHELLIRQRESDFSFLSPREVANVLANAAPANVADLAVLVLDHLDDIAIEIRQENDDGYHAFWNVENGKPAGPREENLCRDVLLVRLRSRLTSFGIDCQPEGDYHNDKRADLRLSYKAEFELPIEIKRSSNRLLWQSLNDQLIRQYSIAPKASGFGIYLVLWFDEKRIPAALDGGKRPRSARELQNRLEALIKPEHAQSIFVRVLDVSWH